MIKVYIGISGSGKTTRCLSDLLNDPNGVRVNRDDLRTAVYGGGSYYDREDLYQCEQFITDLENRIINRAISKGKNVYADNTHLRQKYIKKYYDYGVPVELIWIDTDLDTCITRDRARDRRVGEDVIKIQKEKYDILRREWSGIEQKPRDVIGNNPELPKCVVFDIDGTLAKMNGRSPYDYSRVSEDLVNTPIADIAKRYWKDDDVLVIICTGRDGVCEDDTRNWLIKNGIFFDALYIRKEGDNRADWKVKEEMWKDICKNHYITAMYDDRNQVVDHARSLGFTVCQVDYGDF